jgi:hypothetical protein
MGEFDAGGLRGVEQGLVVRHRDERFDAVEVDGKLG